MKLSVIIVNYNVKHFLDQCLLSVESAMRGIEGEVIVVDNNSVDDSCAMVREKFPTVQLVANKQNTGFSKANNQAIKVARGEYILLLNPDTIVQEDCFSKCLEFMEQRPDAGALGVKMIDGNGNYLPESKRGLPTPPVAFYKIFGLCRLFPRSQRFARYYLGHLSENDTNEIEVLAGAFMFIRKTALDQSGLFDERFFMYGEDIDLSYRLSQTGFKNYYFPETKIIHYKGESTKKGSLNYVKLFYTAMLIFSEKHFSGRQSQLFSILINAAIYFRAAISALSRLIDQLLLPILDFILILVGFITIGPFWESIKYTPGHFPAEFYQLVVPVYSLVWLVALMANKAYAKPIALRRVFGGITGGALAIMVIYSFLPEAWRFSRALILLGFMWTLICLPLYRYFLSLSGKASFKIKGHKKQKLLVIAGKEEAERIRQLLHHTGSNLDILATIAPEKIQRSALHDDFSRITELISYYQPDELVFSGKDVRSSDIIDCMLDLSTTGLQFKIAPSESLSIIGSHSPNTSGELYQIKSSPLSSKSNRLLKRWFDLKIACLIVFFYPFYFWACRGQKQLIRNCMLVIRGKRTWIGYASQRSSETHLPSLKKGIISPATPFESNWSELKKLEADQLYAKNYRILTDLDYVIKNRQYLGR